jgi:uncharacterized protein YutD
MKLNIILIFLLYFSELTAQELNCSVQINASQISGTSRIIFDNMRKDITQFMNSTKWTDYQFENNERIKCSIVIEIKSVQGNRYTSTLQVNSVRPVFEASYESPILRLREQEGNFDFEYIENTPLVFNENRYGDNLTAVLAYYAYIIIGMDFDTFKMEGGTPFFQKAQKIVTNAQGSQFKGWKAYESRKQDNRYFLINKLLDTRNGAARRGMYRYHRQGLDNMSRKVEQARKEIAESLKYLQKVYRVDRNSFLLKVIMDAKYKELVNIFSEAYADQKTQVYNILKEIDPAHLKEYEKLTKSN